ncbi:diguanylate cyclase [Pontibacillus yanchengensis]|uniref:Diguanylate cyclase n=2 Tax=Pontibacillus yanchengensis TaxID=462910 RepID=A0ACC7VFE9_9BACI|nr:diguanylate cyclase [Pontibacillus yanchengensis]MYL52889.1 diguanylate cyclase [Pontibacillus yanchengensis]
MNGWWIGKQFDRVKFLSKRGYLTKAFNRRWVYKKYDRFFNSLETTDRIKVTLVDINQFKQINDHYGHEVGDRAICEVAENQSR